MLQKHPRFAGVTGPVVVVVLDGFGYSPVTEGNAVAQAHTPYIDQLFAKYPHTTLAAHGRAVGMPSDEDMGNSEVGHNAIGAGRVYNQGASLVNDAIASRVIFGTQAWSEVVENVRSKQSTLHFLGLFSDGNVHSHIEHLKALVVEAKQAGAKKVRVHALLDGRDVPETSALLYVEPFEAFLKELNSDGFDARIASGGGRQNITMDRYEANWAQVELGWKTHVRAEGRQFASAKEAIETLRLETKAIDQDLAPFVIAEGGVPVGPVVDGDSVVFFNFRGDRAIEITRAFVDEEFTAFARGPRPDVVYAGMLEYDGDLHLPPRYLVPPPSITETLGQHLVESGISQLAISETQKYGHVTYFWNGNKSGKFSEELETFIEIRSDVVPFEQRPWMKAAEITDALLAEVKTGKYRHIRVNYANGDMVGHTGSWEAALIAIQTLDICLKRLVPVVLAMGGVLLITADHGNADEMFELDKKTGKAKRNPDGTPCAKTAHTLNRVPCLLVDDSSRDAYRIAEGSFGLSNIASTVAVLLGLQPHEVWDRAIIELV